MKKNFYTFNFKNFLRAEIIAIILIVLLETGSWVMLEQINRISKGGDLIKMDSDIFNRNFKKYNTDTQRNKKYFPKLYNSWKELWADAPYDVIVVGDSTGTTGWAEMLHLDYGLKILNTTAILGQKYGRLFWASLVIGNYNNKNENLKTILLNVFLTERVGYDFKDIPNIGELVQKLEGHDIRQKHTFCSAQLVKYLSQKIENIIKPRVEVINIDGHSELFYSDDIKALTENINYNEEERLKLCEQLKYMKDVAAKKGCIYAIIIFPTKPQQYEWLLVKAGRLNNVVKRSNLNFVKEACRKNNIPFLDLEEKLDPIAKQVFLESGKLLWYRCDTHMNEMGAYYSAKLIYNFLSEIRSM